MKLQKRIWMKRLLYGHVENHSKIFQNVNMTKTRKKNGNLLKRIKRKKILQILKNNLNILPSFQHFVVTSSFIIFNTHYNQNSRKVVHGASWLTKL